MKKPEYQRDPETDPHLPHTLHHERRDTVEQNLPPAAIELFNSRFDDIRKATFDYGTGEGMLQVYRLVRDMQAAAQWPDNMAYQIRDFVLSKVSDQKIMDTATGQYLFREKKSSKARKVIESMV